MLFFRCAIFFHLYLLGAVCFHNRVPLGPAVDIPGIFYSTTYLRIPDMYLCIQSAAAAAASAALCCCSAVVAAAAATCCFCHRVPDGIFCAGSFNLIPLFFFSLNSNMIYFSCNPWQYCRMHDLDFAYTTSSVQPAEANPPV